jgi:hypothetical protein
MKSQGRSLVRKYMEQGEKLMRNPTPLTTDDVRRIAVDADAVSAVKRLGCTFYNTCLEQAIEGKWKGFGCRECMAYSEADPHQKMMDFLGLRALQTAAEMLESHGKVHRVPGVKQGADAKRTITLVSPLEAA